MNTLSLLIAAYAIILSIIEGVAATKKLTRLWKSRHLRKIWGIKDGDFVVVVCSELDEEDSQHVEPREFIYTRKYGDIDAYFEVVITLLRLFPRIKLQVMSSGEAESTRVDMTQHVILIGGPDYNAITRNILQKGVTRYVYRSPEENASPTYPGEIVLYCGQTDHESCESIDEKDYGYFERIRNPNNPATNVILIGGCHTLGVTGAAKAYSMGDGLRGAIPGIVLKNARETAKRITRNSEFAVLVSAERNAQTIPAPIVSVDNIIGPIKEVRTPRLWDSLIKR